MSWIRRLKVRFQIGNWWVDVKRLNERAGYRWNGQEWAEQPMNPKGTDER